MSDKFVETTTIRHDNRIGNSVKGFLLGLVLFASSFVLLYQNEGRADLSSIAKTATEISSENVNVDVSLNRKLVSVTGVVSSNSSLIGDNLFLRPGKYLAVERRVEMFSWKEKKETKSQINTGGSETTTTISEYTKDWQEYPPQSSSFSHPEGHENPQKSMSSFVNKVNSAMVGVYNFDLQRVVLPNLTNVPLRGVREINSNILDKDVLLVRGNEFDWIFIPTSGKDGTFGNPAVGDLRVSYYSLVPGFKGTLFGKLNGDRVEAYFDKDGNNFYHLFSGTRDEGIAILHSEYQRILWTSRLVGFLVMWMGLTLIFGPISILLDILPFLGVISRSLVGMITFVLSFVLTIITIAVSMVTHNIIELGAVLVATVAAMIFVLKRKRVGKGKIIHP